MTDKEEKAFQLVYKFYSKWRETIIETDEQWTAFAKEIGQLGADLDIDHVAIGWFLMNAVLNTFNVLYAGGMKPMPSSYFGRDDLER